MPLKFFTGINQYKESGINLIPATNNWLIMVKHEGRLVENTQQGERSLIRNAGSGLYDLHHVLVDPGPIYLDYGVSIDVIQDVIDAWMIGMGQTSFISPISIERAEELVTLWSA